MHSSSQESRPTPRSARRLGACAAVAVFLCNGLVNASSYDELVDLFGDWRAFETPPLLDGAPDYSAERFAKAHSELPALQNRLNDLDTSDWPIDQQVDWHVLRAEMNGFDFNHRVLKPW
ncbi:MAG: hypothetical protein ACI8RN_002324, partial [Glaciecola sp.]